MGASPNERERGKKIQSLTDLAQHKSALSKRRQKQKTLLHHSFVKLRYLQWLYIQIAFRRSARSTTRGQTKKGLQRRGRTYGPNMRLRLRGPALPPSM